ncbi:MAG: c-type cytochrome [Chloroflexota bacterium]
MKTLRLLFILLITLLIAAACGTIADPVPNSATLEAERTEAEAEEQPAEAVVAQEPTSTPVPASPTPLPPTATATLLPPTATPVATEVPPTEAQAAALTAEEENLIFFIEEFSDPGNGETLFNQTYEVEMADGSLGEWTCSTCHVVTNNEAGVGPGMLSYATRAGEQVPGQPAALYTYNSIVNPNAYIVEGYASGVMPVGWAEVLSEQDLYDLSAYLLTLDGE